jgi:diguanylate cyclase (GGDEF)-like protein
MPRRSSKPKKTGEQAKPARASPASRRIEAEAKEATERLAAVHRSTTTQLTAEVKWLEAQLAAARAQVVALEAAVDLDPLLDILSRRGFERELRRALAFIQRYGNSAALIYLDVDRLKPINDRHGHAAGDAVLRTVAAVLTRNVRASDVVARLGGDEFAVLLWNINEAKAVAKAAALEAMVAEQKVLYWDAALEIGVSTGVAQLLPSDQIDDVLRRADQAMYARKAERLQAIRR